MDDQAKSEVYTELEAALDGLYYQSESDYPLEFVFWQKPAGKSLDSDFVRDRLALGEDADIQEGDAQSFLSDCSKIETWFDDEEKKNAVGFEKLRNLLNLQLKNLRLFRAGEIEVTVVVAGEDEMNIVGFKTISIET